jgi:hypothetical protein
MATNRIEERMHRMLSRQATPAWGVNYQPAIRATPREAPRISRPSIIHSAKLGGRGVHLLSQPEFHAGLLALHHPALFDLHEQRVLSTCPAAHPLCGHPAAAGLALSHLEGTVRVADRLQRLTLHPRLFIRRKDSAGEWVPIPFCGDLLLFLIDESGPYCVNWTVKKTQEQFHTRRPRLWGRQKVPGLDPQAEFRHEVERAYYADAGIKTIQITERQIDVQLRHNLREIFPWHLRGISPDIAYGRAVEMLRSFVGTEVTAFEAIRAVALGLRVNDAEMKAVLYRAVWQRDIEVDLYQPFLIDRPLRVARSNPLIEHSNWFAR